MSTSPGGLPAATAATGPKKNKLAAVLLPSWVNELDQIRLALICFALSLALGSVLVISSSWYLRQQHEDAAQALQLRNLAFDKFSHVENEKLEIRNYQPQFIALRSKGLIGEENRLAWVDSIRQIQERRQLLPITYEINAQQPFKIDARALLGDYRLLGSRMDLHMDLLHEMDLFHFLQDLKRRHYYTVQECSLKRSGAVQNATVAPTLAADCTLYWLTLGAAAPPGKEP